MAVVGETMRRSGAESRPLLTSLLAARNALVTNQQLRARSSQPWKAMQLVIQDIDALAALVSAGEDRVTRSGGFSGKRFRSDQRQTGWYRNAVVIAAFADSSLEHAYPSLN